MKATELCFRSGRLKQILLNGGVYQESPMWGSLLYTLKSSLTPV